MRNEEQHIAKTLESLLVQTYPRECYELIVIDGQSSDRSLEIVEDLRRSAPGIRILTNSAGIVPIALNLGILNARGEIIIRADAHTVYPSHYIETCVRCLEETGADNVGGPILTVPANGSLSARLVGAVLSNPFGVGNSRFRTSSREGLVDTVPFGTFRKELFQRIGLFNETLVRNQDKELNARIRNTGGTIYLSLALTTLYYPTDSFPTLLRQTYVNSRWHVYTFRQNAGALSTRHVLPACFAAVLITLMIGSFVTNLGLLALGCLLTIYMVAAVYFSMRIFQHNTPVLLLALPFAFLCFHLAYGLGTMAGLRFLLQQPSTRPIKS